MRSVVAIHLGNQTTSGYLATLPNPTAHLHQMLAEARMSLETPIAFCIYNRPQVTSRVFEAIANVKPKRLLIIADGPNSNRPNDALLVEQTRNIATRIHWDCELETNFAATNLGCAKRMATGLSWAFEQAEELIILEDDCLPDASFFGFCESLLARFRDDEDIMMISGDNFQPAKRTDASYYFSRWPHIWGWASWRRAWKNFELEIPDWKMTRSSNELLSEFCDRANFCEDTERQFWCQIFDQIHVGSIDTWDFSWAYACWKNAGLTILPTVNLVSNIGFGESATHTTDASSRLANIPAKSLSELVHPLEIQRDTIADDFTWHHIIAPPKQNTPAPKPRRWYRRLFDGVRKKTPAG
jgi:hypothetical protein